MIILLNNYVSIKLNSLTLWFQLIFSIIFSPIICGLFYLMHKTGSYTYKNAYNGSAFFVIGIIGLTFIINMFYLMARERINMKHMYINYPIQHFINEYVSKSINILIRLISMISILEIIFVSTHPKIWITSIIMAVIMFIFVFILGDITFNEFIYARNHFIFKNHNYIQNAENTTTIFPKSLELIWNTTRDKITKMASVTRITNSGGIHRMLPYAKQIKVIMNNISTDKCNDTDLNQYDIFEKFYKRLKKLSHKEDVTKDEMTKLAMIWDKIEWINVKKDLDRYHSKPKKENLNELIYFLNYYKTKISDIFML